MLPSLHIEVPMRGGRTDLETATPQFTSTGWRPSRKTGRRACRVWPDGLRLLFGGDAQSAEGIMRNCAVDRRQAGDARK